MASSDVEAVFADDYIPPWMKWNCEELPEKPKPKAWYKEQLRVKPYKPRRRWLLVPPPVYTGSGRCSMEPVKVPEYPTSNRW